MTTLLPQNILKVLSTLHNGYLEEYERDPDDRTEKSQEFFTARGTLLSYLIFKDALTNFKTDGEEELLPALDFIKYLYKVIYDRSETLYIISEDSNMVA